MLLESSRLTTEEKDAAGDGGYYTRRDSDMDGQDIQDEEENYRIHSRRMNMTKRPMIAVLMIAGTMTGCVQYPMGLSEAQWNALPPSQQADYQAKQYQINEDRRRQAEALQAEQARAAALAAEAERARIANLYSSAQYGDIITVSIRGGIMSYGGKSYPCEPIGFDIVRGESKVIEFRGSVIQHGMAKALITRCKVRLSDDASTFYMNDDSARRIVLTNDGSWERGTTRHIGGQGFHNNLDVGMANMSVTIRYRTMGPAPQRMIIEHRH